MDNFGRVEMLRALIIEDDAEIIEAVSLCLQLRWPEVVLASAMEGWKGIRELEAEAFDIVILDINLPDMDGFEVLSKVRAFSDVPVIILTVRGRERERAKGLEMGADDYIVKPFSPIDLVARVNAVLRRAQLPKLSGEQPSLVQGDISLNLTSHEASLRGERIGLTPTEYRLLYVLMKSSGRTVNTKQILREVWGEGQVDSESLRTYIRRLREKLKDVPPQMILTDHGEGYRFISPG